MDEPAASILRPDRSTWADLGEEIAGANLADRLCADQLERWRAGERIPVESYLSGDPGLQADDEALFELVYGEYLVRESLGDSPTLEEFSGRFPRFAGRLRRQVDLHRALRDGGPATLADFEPDEAGGADAGGAPGPDLPGYEVLGELGRGGMGVVYRARQRGLNRLVALKVIRAWLYADPAVAARFRAEAETAARFQHPNIVQVYEVGEHDGQGYLALEYAAGGSLQRRLDGKPRDPRASAALVEVLAMAVHYAHERGIIHRDLKPANVVLTDDGTPKVTDFGLAKLVEHDGGMTRTGEILGTPSYMAPEQAACTAGGVSPVTDVYALGAILYEALTGRPPFLGSSPLSTLEQVHGQDPLPPGRLQRNVPRELETICLKCLEKEPRKRYATARELAEDLRRFLEGRPIRARRVGWAGRIWRWGRREPVKAGLAASLVLAVAVGFAGMAALWRRAAERAGREARERARAEAAEAVARDHLYISQIAGARLEWRLNNVARAGQILDQCEPGRRGWEWHYLRGLIRPELFADDSPTFPASVGLAFSRDGSRLASLCFDPSGGRTDRPSSQVIVRDAATWRPIRSFEASAWMCRLEFSPNGRLLAASEQDGRARIWDVESGREVRTLEAGGTVTFSPDGRRLAAGGKDAVTLWDADTARPSRRIPSPGGRATFSPDGRLLALSGPDAAVILEVESGGEVLRLPHGPGEPEARHFRFFKDEGPGLAFSPDGRQLVVATNPPRIWDLASGQPLHVLGGHDGAVLGVAFGPDGRQVATAGADTTVRLWDAQTGAERGVFRGHHEWVASVAFHPDGWCLASGGRHSGDLKVWDLTRHPEYRALPGADACAIAFDPDGHALRSIDAGGRLSAWEPERRDGSRGPLIDLTREWLTPAVLADYSADGRRLATVAADRSVVKLWDADTGEILTALRGMEYPAVNVVCGPDGRRVAASGMSKTARGFHREIRVWDSSTGRTLVRFRPDSGPSWYYHGAVALSLDGARIAFDDYEGDLRPGDTERPNAVVRVCSLPEGRELIKLTLDKAAILGLTFSPDGRSVAASDLDGRIAISDAATASVLRLQDDASAVFRLAFSPDGRRLAGVDREKVRIWDVREGKELLALRVDSRRALDGGFNPTLAWSPDGRRLATTNWDHSLSLWDGTDRPFDPAARTREALARGFARHPGQAEAALGDGQAAPASSHLGRLRRLDHPDIPSRLRRERLSMKSGDCERARGDSQFRSPVARPSRVRRGKDTPSTSRTATPRVTADFAGRYDLMLRDAR